MSPSFSVYSFYECVACVGMSACFILVHDVKCEKKKTECDESKMHLSCELELAITFDFDTLISLNISPLSRRVCVCVCVSFFLSFQ